MIFHFFWIIVVFILFFPVIFWISINYQYIYFFFLFLSLEKYIYIGKLLKPGEQPTDYTDTEDEGTEDRRQGDKKAD